MVVMKKPEPRNLWLQPYAEHRILAGFLRAEDIQKVQPAAVNWPAEVSKRVDELLGAARNLSPRTEVGQCRIFPVEEPEALDVLQVASQLLPFGADFPVSYSWVEISNLIATASIAGSISQELAISDSNPQELAENSLTGPSSSYISCLDGSLYFSSPINIQPSSSGIEDNQVVLRYRISRVVQPIVVGYEQGRFYLLNAYSRVLSALIGKVDRLLCLVYYGLDLSSAQMGVKLFDSNNGAVAVNHFGCSLLSSDRPPMVTDFLDPSLSAIFPASDTFYMVTPSIQTQQIQFTTTTNAQLPLETSTHHESAQQERLEPGAPECINETALIEEKVVDEKKND
jgi:hypothetical protein